jgi:hypothetical protein
VGVGGAAEQGGVGRGREPLRRGARSRPPRPARRRLLHQVLPPSSESVSFVRVSLLRPSQSSSGPAVLLPRPSRSLHHMLLRLLQHLPAGSLGPAVSAAGRPSPPSRPLPCPTFPPRQQNRSRSPTYPSASLRTPPTSPHPRPPPAQVCFTQPEPPPPTPPPPARMACCSTCTTAPFHPPLTRSPGCTGCTTGGRTPAWRPWPASPTPSTPATPTRPASGSRCAPLAWGPFRADSE